MEVLRTIEILHRNDEEVKRSNIGIDNYRKELKKHARKENGEFNDPKVMRMKKPILQKILDMIDN